jgi:molybdate transport system ATP-binding protein
VSDAPAAKLEVSLHSTAPVRLDAQFDCAPGELVALVGPSGSGKTSLLRAVAGLLPGRKLRGRISAGENHWFDSERGIDLPPQRRQVGLVFQHYALFPHLSAYDNVAIAVGAAAKEPIVHSLLQRLGLGGLEQRRPAQLSGGQQQRVALARALAREPKVLLLDEPFSAVDAPARQALYRELAALRQSMSTPMILVTHDLAEARRLADRVVILDQGSTLQCGTPAQIFASPRNARVAELVGIQNHFGGRFHKQELGWARLTWGADGSVSLRVVDKNRIEDGVQVTWVIAGDRIELLPDGNGNGDSEANTLRCEVMEQLALGETSLCVLRPQGLPLERVTLNLSTAQLRSLHAQPGRWLRLAIAPEAIHIMPQKNRAQPLQAM